ncbi:MAG: AMP-binding protein [Proteobacteria bacterium]|nr:long-chain fatty acid--CoA ligase [Desulfobacula sp.]MBU3951569.1 AMP-binding protein [Pseudomonadota bacterium]MBU4132233.1 AMP-binding protein [Pseudomonadota bacterium]
MLKDRPWFDHYAKVPRSIAYPNVTMYEAMMQSANRVPDKIAWDFMGTLCTYKDFAQAISHCADGLASLGLKKGDTITISMPTSPQGIICFYAANKLGAMASMIHPLSTETEIEFYLNLSNSSMALTLDAFYGKFSAVMDKTPCKRLVLARIGDYLSPVKQFGFWLTKGRKIPKVPEDPRVSWWQEIMKGDFPKQKKAAMTSDDTAVILYSGGTTGKPKGILLSNMNFISEGMMVATWGNLNETDAILAILPIFHGFGLGVCVNAAFMGGAKSILVPQFTPEIVAKLIRTKKPTFIIGVPTLYAALNKNKDFIRADLACLKAAFCGADTLPKVVKEDFEAIVRARGGNVKLLEGYGLTEAVTAIMAMPLGTYRPNSVGVPFPDMDAKIVLQNTLEEAPIGEDGEICLSGPAVMQGYLNQKEENDKTLKVHADGKTWLHTGDIASQDSEGFFYFKLRQKRMIKSSGMNVYPAQVEDVLYQHPCVAEACVIGVPDKEQVERVKAFVVLKKGALANGDMEKDIIAHCRKALIKWSCPRNIEFRETLPTTLVGKVAFKKLEDQEIESLRQQGEYTGDH